jgi:aminopeptidase N
MMMMRTDYSVIRLEDYRPTPYAIPRLAMTFELHPEKTCVRNEMHIEPKESSGKKPALILNGEGLKLLSVELNGETLASDHYQVDDKHLTIPQPPEQAFTLTVTTEINPTANTRLEGLYRTSNTYCTQCEAEGFRRITYFYDRPDCLSVYDVRLEAPVTGNPHLLSNGNLIDSGPLAEKRDGSDWHFAQWHDPHPKPAYLFGCVAGDLARIEDSFTTSSGREVDLHIYVEHGKEDRVSYAMDALKRSMRWDEEVYGREYDLDLFQIVAVSDFNMGAMENKGLNIFNDKYVLAKPDTATDTDYALIEAIIAHEYFHNWTGNRITCRDWFQLCLKEGLTVFRDQEFSSDMRSRAVKRIEDTRQLRSRQFPEDGGPLAHPVRPESYSEINNFYTATVYEKGAELCRMIKTILGDDAFSKGLDLYFERHDGEAATIEDFLKAFTDASGKDLSQFSLWYSQAGTPDVVVTSSYNAKRKELTLAVEQSCPATPGQPTKRAMHIPVRFGLIGDDGHEVPFTGAHGGDVDIQGNEGILHIRERKQSFVLEGVESAALPSLLRGFSAPVRLRSNLTDDNILHLMQHDSDSFNRWEASQYLLMRALIKKSERGNPNEPGQRDLTLIDALGKVILDPNLDMAFRAEILAIPSETDIAREIGRNVDPDAIHIGRETFRQTLAERLQAQLTDLYHSLKQDGPYIPDAEGSGRRALRNRILDLLVMLPDDSGTELATAQFKTAGNMTDRFAALASLTHHGKDAAKPLLASFYEQFKDDALVIDKWLSLQATSPKSDCLETVQSLLDHPSFSLSNPNRTRALIGAFAMNNACQFNREDGKGYTLVADIILELDDKNPQTAARLLNNFRSWRVLEEGRQAKARAELERIAATNPLSKDVSDIVNRCLH